MRASLIACAALALTACGGSDGSSRPRPTPTPTAPPANLMSPTIWQIGPVVNGANVSAGMPLSPALHPDGWSVDIPQPTRFAGHLHAITFRHGPLTGKSEIRLRYRIEMDPAAAIVPGNATKDFPGSPASIALFFQRRGDDWSARGKYEAYRWFATATAQSPLVSGEHEIVASLSSGWTAVLTSSSSSNPAGFRAAIDDADRVGLVFGGGDGWAHGIYATAPARFVVTGFEIR